MLFGTNTKLPKNKQTNKQQQQNKQTKIQQPINNHNNNKIRKWQLVATDKI